LELCAAAVPADLAASRICSLWKVAAHDPQYFRSGRTAIVRRNPRHTSGYRVGAKHLPDHLFGQDVALHLAAAVDGPEHVALHHAGWSRPSIDCNLDPGCIGTVRTRPCLPTRSTMHHRPSRCCMCLSVSAATSDRRRPQPSSTAIMARSRKPFVVVTSGAFRSACAFRYTARAGDGVAGCSPD
jgi:hypothetical protein